MNEASPELIDVLVKIKAALCALAQQNHNYSNSLSENLWQVHKAIAKLAKDKSEVKNERSK
jgi:hypothetical protein